MPKVAIDLRMVHGRLHGIARYALSIAARLPSLAPDLTFVGVVGPAGLPDSLGSLRPDLPCIPCPVPFLHPLEQPALAATLWSHRVDLFHATSFSMPAFWPGRLVATLHDAVHLSRAEEFGWQQRLYYDLVVRPRARTARALVTVSEFSRTELAQHLGLSPERFQVIPNGVAPHFRRHTAGDTSPLRKRWHLPERWYAGVAGRKPYKNLSLLLRVAPTLPYPLALLHDGEPPPATPNIIPVGPFDDSDLAAFYGGSTALALPSRHEGFGLPALEAMACGTPVVASNTGALPEVIGEAGVLRGPEDVPGWSEALQRLARDAALRASLSERAFERATRFTWDDCARRTLAVYRRAL